MSVNALSIYGNYLLLLKTILRSSQYISILSFILSHRNNVSNSFVNFFLRFFIRYVVETFLFDENIWSDCQNYFTAKYTISTWGLFQDNEKVLNPSICWILSRLLHEILISYFLIYFWCLHDYKFHRIKWCVAKWIFILRINIF